MSLDASALRNLCLGASSKAADYSSSAWYSPAFPKGKPLAPVVKKADNTIQWKAQLVSLICWIVIYSIWWITPSNF